MIRIGLCGLGVVGRGLLDLLAANGDCMGAGRDFQVTHLGMRSPKPGLDTSAFRVSRDVFSVAQDPEVDILVELIGGVTDARRLVLEAIRRGKHVITANKALLAEHGAEVMRLAREQGVTVGFEAAVAGGIPVIKLLREAMAANRVTGVSGILNGTANYILSAVRETGCSFAEALREAQEKGYAEADPTLDVSGGDAAHKLAILAALAFRLPLSGDLRPEGISKIIPGDMTAAAEFGYSIKHLGIARLREGGLELRVEPFLVPLQSPFAGIEGVTNSVLIEAQPVGSICCSGPGAGAGPTASAVAADLLDMARTLGLRPEGPASLLSLPAFDAEEEGPPLLSPLNLSQRRYLRLSLSGESDEIGWDSVAETLSVLGIGFRSHPAGDMPGSAGVHNVAVLTDPITGEQAQEATVAISKLNGLAGECLHLCVEE